MRDSIAQASISTDTDSTAPATPTEAPGPGSSGVSDSYTGSQGGALPKKPKRVSAFAGEGGDQVRNPYHSGSLD
jgi:hypothetical protein